MFGRVSATVIDHALDCFLRVFRGSAVNQKNHVLAFIEIPVRLKPHLDLARLGDHRRQNSFHGDRNPELELVRTPRAIIGDGDLDFNGQLQ